MRRGKWCFNRSEAKQMWKKFAECGARAWTLKIKKPSKMTVYYVAPTLTASLKEEIRKGRLVAEEWKS